MSIEYELIRSDRRTVSLEIKDMRVIVRAPRNMDLGSIERFINDHSAWIETQTARENRRRMNHPEPTCEQRAEYIRRAKSYLPGRVEYYSRLMGLCPSGITITGARTRLGSCSNNGRLAFSWRLMQYPSQAADYVVVHELAHLQHMNHGREFYALIEKYMPDYKARQRMLRE